jgi:cellulose synthase/poly-beta-1,6-N-acetylglucosamine synthase-like glycosyltransferase
MLFELLGDSLLSVSAYLLGILTFGYALAITLIAFGLFRLAGPGSTARLKVSVIVAARNEERNIGALLAAIFNQDYPADHYEIIIVDDVSTDNTAEIIERYRHRKEQPALHYFLAEGREKVISPKKHALNIGISRAAGEIILLTDADCLPPPGWISKSVRYFEPSVGMVIGFSPYELPGTKSLWDHLLALDSLALAAVAAGTTGWGSPATCNGRNFAYRKEVFDQVGGFENIKQFVSGDDDLFMRLVMEKTDWRVRYAFDCQLAVPTRLLTSWRQFYNQRIRHASKGRHYGWRAIAILSMTYIYNLVLMASLPIAFLVPHMRNFILIVWTIKSFFELGLISLFAHRMRRMKHLLVFPIAEALHVAYVVVFGALGLFARIRWKEEVSIKTRLDRFRPGEYQ